MRADRTYFRRRADEEREAAAVSDGKARLAHQELADLYTALSDERGSPEPSDRQPSA